LASVSADTSIEYSFVIPHDAKTLIQFMGGDADFERRLDYIMKPNTIQQDLGANGAGINTIMNIGWAHYIPGLLSSYLQRINRNEPDFATPYLYNYINKQAKSVQKSRALANEFFHDAPYGVPGNSDAGALNSWLIWQMLGIYPIVTQPVYLIESPWFEDINMTINGNKTLRITASGLNNNPEIGTGNSTGGFYVQSVKINGKEWVRNWFKHSDVMIDGGRIEFQLGREAKSWERGEVPPSPGHLIL
jgi:putative alpha-1,2-mannosidase